MISTIGFLLFIVFLFLSGVHIYWGFGGKWASAVVLPTENDETLVMKPNRFATFMVAFVLFNFGLIELYNTFTFEFQISVWLEKLLNYGLWAIFFIFSIRAIGDFKYVGFFKKIKNTKFAMNDTKYYTPLCLIIAILNFITLINKQ